MGFLFFPQIRGGTIQGVEPSELRALKEGRKDGRKGRKGGKKEERKK
jgi:hypothetical protein